MESGYVKGLHAKSKWELHVNRTVMDNRELMSCRLPDIPETTPLNQVLLKSQPDTQDDVKKQVRFNNHSDEEQVTELTELTAVAAFGDSADSVMVTTACSSTSASGRIDGQKSCKRRRGSRGSLGPTTRALVNRTDSEKLYCKPIGEMLFSMKGEGSPQYFIVPDLSTRCSLEEASYYSVEEMEYYDAPQSPVGRQSLTDGNELAQQHQPPLIRLEMIEAPRRASMQGRRRSSFPDTVDTRLLFSLPGGEHEERILETLRGVVRMCTNSDPDRRPTASQVLRMLTMTI